MTNMTPDNWKATSKKMLNALKDALVDVKERCSACRGHVSFHSPACYSVRAVIAEAEEGKRKDKLNYKVCFADARSETLWIQAAQCVTREQADIIKAAFENRFSWCLWSIQDMPSN